MAASDGLLAYYTFTEDVGDNKIDMTGNGNTLIDNGRLDYAKSVEGYNDHSLYGDEMDIFDADYSLYVPEASLPLSWPGKKTGATCVAYTIYLRSRATTSSHAGNDRGLCGKHNVWDGVNTVSIYQQFANPSTIIAGHHDGTDVHAISDSTGSDTTNFHAWVSRWQGDTDDEFSFWDNGVKNGTTHSPTTLQTTGGNGYSFTIGAANAGSTPCGMVAAMDEFAIWDRALTDAEIVSLSNNGIASFMSRRHRVIVVR